jgi:adenylate cyclase
MRGEPVRKDPVRTSPSSQGEHHPTDRAIRAELSSILSSPEFRSKPTLSRFLQFVVEQALAGNAHQIKGYTIATQVLNKSESFDAVKDPSVRILGGRLRASLDRYYAAFGREDPVLIEMPRGTYVPVFHHHAVGNEAARSSSARLGRPDASMPTAPGIAVLPLRSLSGDSEGERFAEGLTDELLAELVRYQDFSVVPYRSRASAEDSGINIRELGLKLNVQFILEGSVRKDGGCVKVAFGLIDVTTGIQIWGERFRSDSGDGGLIRIQEEIAVEVAAKIADTYGIISQKLTGGFHQDSPEEIGPHQALLRLREYSIALTGETFSAAWEALEHARGRSPKSGMVWSMLANLCADDNILWAGKLKISMEQALKYARKGAHLEPRNQYIRAILAYLYFLVGDLHGFFVEVETALALNPNSLALTAFMGWTLALAGKWGRGMHLLKKGMASNPHYPPWFHVAPCLHHYGEGRFEAAYQEALRIQMPELFWDWLLRAATLGRLGRATAARQAIDVLLERCPDFPTSARRRIGFFVKAENHISGLVHGLTEAGLRI